MDKIQELLNKSIHHLQVADHMAYVTYPLINEKRFLLKIFEQIYFSITNCLNAIMELEKKGNNLNFDNFFKKYYKKYDLTNSDIEKIREILEISNKHKESSMEFVRNEKIVILSNNLKFHILDIHLVKSYLLIAKELLLKTSIRINKS
ncbi:MAG: hypothetical protein PHF67_02955 [Candidatus Nanoarchaeia archaeon]|nr:hypothetical protein [Candidatus Nanoarchaeia archaeon]